MKVKRQLLFDTDNKKERITNDLFEACPTKYRSRITAIALYELATKYNLLDATEMEIRKFCENYHFIIAGQQALQTMPNQASAEIVVSTPTPPPPSSQPVKAENSLISDDDRARMERIMNGSLFY